MHHLKLGCPLRLLAQYLFQPASSGLPGPTAKMCIGLFIASVLASNSVLRSLFGAAFPLFTTYMYKNLGIHWASSVPAFLAVAYIPFPFLFYKYGETIRIKCKYAAEAANVLQKMRTKHEVITEDQAAEEVHEAELERRASNALRRSLTNTRTGKSIQ
ncbi:hypothetical protein LB505_010303 [Fusarium chuoi]|nr:hypothetical protein LB505_010303 [Fusarium chuoi]